MKIEVIRIVVNPATADKLQTDVVALEKDGSDKQQVIEKLQSDLVAQQQTTTALNERVGILENLKP